MFGKHTHTHTHPPPKNRRICRNFLQKSSNILSISQGAVNLSLYLGSSPSSLPQQQARRKDRGSVDMVHGGYAKRRVARRPSLSGPARGGNKSLAGGSRGLGVRHKDGEKKIKIVSIKNQIRSVERLLKKALPLEVKNVQQKRLKDLRNQAELHAQSELERKMALRYRKVKFFERRKIERAIRRLEKLQRASTDHPTEDSARQAADASQQLAQLKEDLEYVRFFPKTQNYVSLFMGNDDENVMAKRSTLRELIKANLAAAAASGVELEETGSEEDAVELSEDDFFLVGSSSDDADADDEWTDKSPMPGDDKDDTSREVVLPNPKVAVLNTEQQHQRRLSNLGSNLRASGKALKTMSSDDERNQRQESARALMPPPRTPSYPSSSNSGGLQSRNWHSSGNSSEMTKASSGPSSSNSEEFVMTGNHPSSRNSWDISKVHGGQAGNGSSNSDAQQKPRRKRLRPRKRKKAAVYLN